MATTNHPIVLRFQGLRPEQLSRFELHRLRKQMDGYEFEPHRTRFNKLLIGSETWAKEALAEIDEMRMENFATELGSLAAFETWTDARSHHHRPRGLVRDSGRPVDLAWQDGKTPSGKGL